MSFNNNPSLTNPPLAHQRILLLHQTPAITYSRGIQTSTSFPNSSSSSSLDILDPDDPSTTNKNGRETEEEMRKHLELEFHQEKERLEKEIRQEEEQRRVIEARIVELSEVEKQVIFGNPEFGQFVEDSTKIIQRALSDGYDYIRDYRIGVDAVEDASDASAVKLVCSFTDERWTKNRSITSVDWSPKYPELVAASYNKNPRAVQDPDGIVAVWNMHLLERPEFIFHSQSDILSVTFSPFHPNLLFGGTYSGQILLWDTRAKHLPVLKTPLSSAGHTYPVYALKLVGTQNAHNLVSTSTDGMVCAWLADMLAQPQEILELTNAGHNKTNEVSITCLDFPDNETASFWVGTEEGGIYQANRYDRAATKAGLNQKESYRGHSGPVTSLHFHPLKGPVDFSDLFLTSGVDWTTKLWRAKTGSKTSAATAAGTGATAIQPLISFEESDDYVYDVKWHPHQPAVFGTVDGAGKFDVWNLNDDAETPVSSISVGSGRAINKLAWDKKDGRRAALGSSDGLLHIYDIGDMAVPRDNEWAEMQKTVQGIMQQSNGKDGGLDTAAGLGRGPTYGFR